MSVVEYSSQFHSLGTYTPTIMADEALKMHRFKKGLNSRIQSALAAIEPISLDQMMGASIRAENDIKRHEGENKLKLPVSTHYKQPDQQSKKPRFSRDRLVSSQNKGTTPNKEIIWCPSCKTTHISECRINTGACFCCGKMDHRVAHCPFPDPRNGPTEVAAPYKPKENKPNARVYDLSHKEADNSSDVVAGTILANNMQAYVLFDCGATHSFISKRFAKIIRIKSKILKEPYRAISANRTLETNILYKDVNIRIGTQDFKTNLIQLNIVEFDVILGMDWLSKNHVVVYCHEKTVTIKAPNQEEYFIPW